MRIPLVIVVVLLACPLLAAQGTRRLWNGQFPAGTQLVCPEMGVAFTVPAGTKANFWWGNAAVGFEATDGSFQMNIWLMTDVAEDTVMPWLTADSWTDRQGQPMRVKGPTAHPGNLQRVEKRSPLDLGLGAWKRGPGRSGTASFAWAAPDQEARMLAAQDALLGSVVHFQPSRSAAGLHGLSWLGWLGGMKLVAYEQYSSGDGSGYSAQWRMDLCWDGSFTQSSGFSASFGQDVGSAASYDPSRGLWSIDAYDENAVTLTMHAQGGNALQYDVSYDPQTERTYVGNTRYFRVPNEWCEYPAQAPPIPQQVLALLGGGQAGGAKPRGAAPAPKPTPKPRDPAPRDPAPQPAAPAASLDGTWIAPTQGYGLVMLGDRYEFYLADGFGGWQLNDAGSFQRKPRVLVTRSDDGSPADTHAFSLDGDVLNLDLEGMVRFERQRED